MSTIYKRPLRSDELMHFGVKGMHWGVRHDPYRTRGQRFRRSVPKPVRRVSVAARVVPMTVLGVAVCHQLGVRKLVSKIPVKKLVSMIKKPTPADVTAAGLFAGTLALGYAHVKKQRESDQWQ